MELDSPFGVILVRCESSSFPTCLRTESTLNSDSLMLRVVFLHPTTPVLPVGYSIHQVHETRVIWTGVNRISVTF